MDAHKTIVANSNPKSQAVIRDDDDEAAESEIE